MPTLNDDVPEAARELAARLAEPRPMRRGSVSERYMKCGQLACRCQEDAKARHGPYYSVTRAEGGKTRSRYLDEAQAAMAREQVEAGQQFRKDLEAYWQASEKWADAQIEAPQAASGEAAKKGGSKRLSRKRSSQKSRR